MCGSCDHNLIYLLIAKMLCVFLFVSLNQLTLIHHTFRICNIRTITLSKVWMLQLFWILKTSMKESHCIKNILWGIWESFPFNYNPEIFCLCEFWIFTTLVTSYPLKAIFNFSCIYLKIIFDMRIFHFSEVEINFLMFFGLLRK